MEKNDILLKDYEICVELFKYYLSISIQLNLFYYAITGAILSFHFTQENVNISIIALLLPILLSLGFGILFLYGAKLAYNFKVNLKKRADKLGLENHVNAIILVFSCIIFGVIMLIVGIVLILYLLNNGI